MESGGLIILVFAVAGFFLTIVGCSAYLYYGRLWFRSRIASTHVPLKKMVAMTFHGVSAFNVVNAYIEAGKAGIEVDLDQLEEHDRARGRVRNVVRAMVAAKNAGTELSLGEALALDLQGKNVTREMNKLV